MSSLPTLERSPAGVTVSLPREELLRLREENAALRRELQLAVDNACACYVWDGHLERVQQLYGIRGDVTQPPSTYTPGASRELEIEREAEDMEAA